MKNVKEILPTQSIYTQLYVIQSLYANHLLDHYISFAIQPVRLDGTIKRYIRK